MRALIVSVLLTFATAAQAAGPGSIYKPFPKRRLDPPVIAYVTSRSVDQARDCIVESVSDHRQLGFSVGMTNIDPLPNGWMIRSPGDYPTWFADVTPTAEGGSDVKVWLAGRLASSLRKRLEACAV